MDVENLRALVYGHRLNQYQRHLAQLEFEKLTRAARESEPRIRYEGRGSLVGEWEKHNWENRNKRNKRNEDEETPWLKKWLKNPKKWFKK